MHLIAKRKMRTRAGTRLAAVPADRAEERTRTQIGKVPNWVDPRQRDARLKDRRLPNHLYSILKQDHRLIFLSRRRIYLRARFAIGHHAIKADASGER